MMILSIRTEWMSWKGWWKVTVKEPVHMEFYASQASIERFKVYILKQV